MTIIQKGIILLGLPILAQFVFVIALLFAYRSTEELAAKDLQYRNQTAELMGTTVLCYRCTGLLVTIGVTQDASLLAAFDNVYEKLARKGEFLDLLASHDHSVALDSTRNYLKKAIESLAHLRMMLNLNTPIMRSNSQLALDLERDLERTLTSLEELIAERSRAGLTDSRRIEESRKLILGSVIGGFIANMLICAGLLAMFARDFASRFTLLVENTRRISEGTPMNPVLGGKDELAELDKVMHEMNASLKETEQRKEQLVSMVSHDLRNPLAAVTVALDIVLSQPENLGREAESRLNKMQRVIRRLNSLVNDVLDLEKLRAGKLRPRLTVVDAREIVAECVTELESIAQQAEVEIENACAEVLVVCDKERLAQILVNLIGNSLKFSPRKGIVTINCVEDGEFYKFQVQDRGPGVPEAFREIIFLPFEQIPDQQRQQKGSTGLGLPICKMLVDLHGGKIGVESSSAGSTFWFTMPRAEVEVI